MNYFFVCFFVLMSLCVISANANTEFSEKNTNNEPESVNAKIDENIEIINTGKTKNEESDATNSQDEESTKVETTTTIEPVLNDTKNGSKRPQFNEILYTTDKPIIKSELNNIGFNLPLQISYSGDSDKYFDFVLEDRMNSNISACFNISEDTYKKVINITVQKKIPRPVLQKHFQLIFVLSAVENQSKEISFQTVLIINLQNGDLNKTKTLTFSKPNYEISTLVEYTGILEQFSAVLHNGSNEIITYSICSYDADFPHDALMIDQTTGILYSKKKLKPNLLKFSVCADTDDKKFHNETKVSLIVEHVVSCNSEQRYFMYSLLVVRVPEGKSVKNIVQPVKSRENCVFNISSQKPQGDYFNLNKNKGSLSLKKAIHLNDTIFKKMREPKFVVELSIICDKKTENVTDKINGNVTTSTDEEETNNNDYSSLKYDPTRMTVFVLVQGSTAKKDGDVNHSNEGKNYFAISVIITLLIFVMILAVTGFHVLFIRRSNTPLKFVWKNSDREAVTSLENNAERPSQTNWIHPRVNLFNNYNQMTEERRTSADFVENHRVSFSNNTGKLVLLGDKNYLERSNPLSAGGISTFKPCTQNNQHIAKNLNNEQTNMKYSDIDVPAILAHEENSSPDMTKNDIPVLQVISLPPPAAGRRRNQNRTSSHNDQPEPTNQSTNS